MKRMVRKIVLLIIIVSLLSVLPAAADMGPLYPWSWEPVNSIHDRDAINDQVRAGHPIQTYRIYDFLFTPPMEVVDTETSSSSHIYMDNLISEPPPTSDSYVSYQFQSIIDEARTFARARLSLFAS